MTPRDCHVPPSRPRLCALVAPCLAALALAGSAALAEVPPPPKCQVFQNQSFDPDSEAILRNESDTNCDGKFDEVIQYENNQPKRAEKDSTPTIPSCATSPASESRSAASSSRGGPGSGRLGSIGCTPFIRFVTHP